MSKKKLTKRQSMKALGDWADLVRTDEGRKKLKELSIKSEEVRKVNN